MYLNRKAVEVELARKLKSLQELSKSTGIPRTTLYSAMRKQTSSPQTIGKIAKALRIDPKILSSPDEK